MENKRPRCDAGASALKSSDDTVVRLSNLFVSQGAPMTYIPAHVADTVVLGGDDSFPYGINLSSTHLASHIPAQSDFLFTDTAAASCGHPSQISSSMAQYALSAVLPPTSLSASCAPPKGSLAHDQKHCVSISNLASSLPRTNIASHSHVGDMWNYSSTSTDHRAHVLLSNSNASTEADSYAVDMNTFQTSSSSSASTGHQTSTEHLAMHNISIFDPSNISTSQNIGLTCSSLPPSSLPPYHSDTRITNGPSQRIFYPFNLNSSSLLNSDISPVNCPQPPSHASKSPFFLADTASLGEASPAPNQPLQTVPTSNISSSPSRTRDLAKLHAMKYVRGDVVAKTEAENPSVPTPTHTMAPVVVSPTEEKIRAFEREFDVSGEHVVIVAGDKELSGVPGSIFAYPYSSAGVEEQEEIEHPHKHKRFRSDTNMSDNDTHSDGQGVVGLNPPAAVQHTAIPADTTPAETTVRPATQTRAFVGGMPAAAHASEHAVDLNGSLDTSMEDDLLWDEDEEDERYCPCGCGDLRAVEPAEAEAGANAADAAARGAIASADLIPLMDADAPVVGPHAAVGEAGEGDGGMVLALPGDAMGDGEEGVMEAGVEEGVRGAGRGVENEAFDEAFVTTEDNYRYTVSADGSDHPSSENASEELGIPDVMQEALPSLAPDASALPVVAAAQVAIDVNSYAASPYGTSLDISTQPVQQITAQHTHHANISNYPGRHVIDVSPDYASTGPHPYLTFPQDPVAFPQALAGEAVMSLLTTMRAQETNFPFRLLRDRTHKHRRVLVDWCVELAELCKLSQLTIQLAVKYFDFVIITLPDPPQKEKVQLLILACLYVAAKFSEHSMVLYSRRTRFIDRLLYVSSVQNSREELVRMETLVLEKLHWRLHVPTPLHFLETVAHCGTLFLNDTVKGLPPTRENVSFLRKFLGFFTELYLQDSSVQHYLPSSVCAAIIACARRAVCIVPIWNPLLEKTTGCHEGDFYNCYVRLFDFYLASFDNVPLATEESVVALERAAIQKRR